MRVDGRTGYGKSRTNWEDRIEKMGQKHRNTRAEMKSRGEDGFDWQKWIEKCYHNALTTKGT